MALPKSMKRIIWLSATAVVLALVVLAMVYTPPVAVTTAKVRKGTIRAYVDERAKTTLPRIYKITMPVSGIISPITLSEGDQVSEGQTVAALDMFDLDNEVATAQASVDEIKAQIALNQDNSLEQTAMVEIKRWIAAFEDLSKSSKELIKAAQAQRDYANTWLDANRKLAKQGAEARIKYEQAKMESAQAEVEVATDKLNSSAITIIKTVVELGPKYIADYLSRKNIKKQALLERLALAELALAKAVHNRDISTMTSPVDGVVLKRHVQNNRYLDQGTLLLEIGVLDQMEVTADILTEDALAIIKGNQVAITGSGLGTEGVKGIVAKVDPMGFTKLSSLGVEQQRVKVKIWPNAGDMKKLAESGRSLGVDYRVQVRVFTASAKDALIIPRMSAFRGDKGQWQVYVVKGGKAYMKNIETGIINDTELQVKTGLNQDEEVIYAPPKDLADQAEVESAGSV